MKINRKTFGTITFAGGSALEIIGVCGLFIPDREFTFTSNKIIKTAAIAFLLIGVIFIGAGLILRNQDLSVVPLDSIEVTSDSSTSSNESTHHDKSVKHHHRAHRLDTINEVWPETSAASLPQ